MAGKLMTRRYEDVHTFCLYFSYSSLHSSFSLSLFLSVFSPFRLWFIFLHHILLVVSRSLSSLLLRPHQVSMNAPAFLQIPAVMKHVAQTGLGSEFRAGKGGFDLEVSSSECFVGYEGDGDCW